MTFLAPWAMALGLAGAAGLVLLHLVARQRPAAYLLPTARFVPDRQTLVSRAASRPRDLPLLLLRVLVLLCASAAFARPVIGAGRTTRARIVLLDRSAAVADSGDAARRARALVAGVTEGMVIKWGGRGGDRVGPGSGRTPTRLAGSLSAALVAARRAAPAFASRADSVELDVVSPVTAGELDAATWPVRAQWPGAIVLDRVAARADSIPTPALERAMSLDDALGPALIAVPRSGSTHLVRVRRRAGIDASDSAFARAGGLVVLWDSATSTLAPHGLALGDDVLVAAMGSRPLPSNGRVIARWADGSAAAAEASLGAGCLRTVGIFAPPTGDLALRPAFQRIVRGLTRPCARSDATLADSASIARLMGGRRAAVASALAAGTQPPSPIVRWLLAAAMLCAVMELAVRYRTRAEEAA